MSRHGLYTMLHSPNMLHLSCVSWGAPLGSYRGPPKWSIDDVDLKDPKWSLHRVGDYTDLGDYKEWGITKVIV